MHSTPRESRSRRWFLQRTAQFATGVAAVSPLAALAAAPAVPSHRRQGPVPPVGGGYYPFNAGVNLDEALLREDNAGYGTLVPSNLGEELYLPEDFTATVVSEVGTTMTNGQPVPPAHDGMACFDMGDGTLRLIRNHELGNQGVFGGNAYDDHMGGTTTVVVDATTGEHIETHASITGLIRPCGGGPTPWGSWLACEETTATSAKRHGYVFEVPVDANAPVDPVPLVAMGRMNHEAAAVDPVTGCVYETEDKDRSGIFRFTPVAPGVLEAGGRLEMLQVDADGGQSLYQRARRRYDTRTGQTVGAELPVSWVPITDPDPSDEKWAADGGQSLYREGLARGGATFARGEGAWTRIDTDEAGHITDVRIYWASTSGGNAAEGQIWEYTPGPDDTGGTLKLLFESPGSHVLGHPDNIAVHPGTGVVVLCEDGGGSPVQVANVAPDDLYGDTPLQELPPEEFNRRFNRRQRVHGVTADGKIFKFAEQFGSEFAGACWSPDGETFFVNIQGNGRTYAIRGPWEKGPLGA